MAKVKGTEGIPKNWMKLVGTKQIFSWALFSRKKNITEEEYDVLDIRWGSATIINMKTLKNLHPTVELLLKNSKMKKSMWTNPFPVREIKLK